MNEGKWIATLPYLDFRFDVTVPKSDFTPMKCRVPEKAYFIVYLTALSQQRSLLYTLECEEGCEWWSQVWPVLRFHEKIFLEGARETAMGEFIVFSWNKSSTHHQNTYMMTRKE
jgi:hypothetical protein